MGGRVEWSVTGRGTVANGGTVFVPSAHDWEGLTTEVVCTKRDDKSRILLQARKTFEAVACERPQTNIVGACWLSSHDPDDPSDHEPRVEEHVVRYFPNCPPTTNVTVVAGFTHDTAILWIRNLVRIVTGDPMDDETDHCIAWEWAEHGIVDLWKLVATSSLPFTNAMYMAIDGRHGNQACYRADGSLIRSGMSGGTADFAAGAWDTVRSHVREDVNPFLHSLHLDGNPCGITTFNNITRPCLRQGEFIDKYIQCRPVVQP